MPDSPVNDLVDDALLFRTRLSQVNARSFDAFMPHQICQHGDAVAALQEAFGEAVAEILYCYILYNYS